MASYIDQISSLNPKIWFKFNETAGTPTNSGSLACSLTATGTPLLNTDSSVDGRSIYLDGSSHYTTSNFPAFSVFDDRSFSIEGWFKVPTVGTVWQYPVLVRDSAFTTSYVFCRILGTTAASSVIGKLEFTFKPGSGYSPYTVYSTSRVDDNKWHHFVLTVNTTSMKLYIDGGLISQTSISTPASINFDGSNTIKTIGEGILGNIDEVAVYPVELTSSQINANYVAGSAVYATPDVLTASAAFPMTTSITVVNYAAAPMTASALAEDALQNDLDLPQSLNTYMGTLTLEQWYKFDEYRKITNYGTGGSSAWSFYGTTDTEFNGGVQGSGAIKFTGDAGDGTISGYGTSPAVINPELTDGDFSIGFWVKKNNIDDNANILQFTNFTNYIDITFNAIGEIDANYHSNQDHVLNTGVDVTDGEWHFLVFRLSGTTLSLYLDGSSVDTTTVNNTFTTALTDYAFSQGNNGSDAIHLSQFFIATSSNVGATQVSNMWTYGTVPSQGGATMVTPLISFNNAFNTFVTNKTPWIDVRMDEASGAPVNYTNNPLTLSATASNYTQGISSKNRYAYNVTNRDTRFEGAWTSPTGTFTTNNKQTLAVYAKMTTITAAAGIASTGSTGGAYGVGLTLIALANSGYIRLRVNSTTSLYDQIDTTTSYCDNNYHLFVAVKDGSSLKLYIDGKEAASGTSSYNLTDSGTFTIAGQPNTTPSGARNITIDEVSMYDRAFTAAEAFDMWQSLSLEMDTTATSTFVMPTIAAGTGPTIAADEMTASANMEKPGNFANHMEAFALFQLPNFGATVNVDSNYGASPLTASALMHDPQYNIGDEHSADHMDASALMVNPLIVTPGRFTANPLIALDATLVMPGIVTVKGARVFVDTFNASALIPIPPAYIQLADDAWFNRLLNAHSDRLTEPVQAFLGNLPNQSSGDVIQGGFLTFFDDVTLDITPTTTIKTLKSEIPEYFFHTVESGNTEQTKAETRATATRNSSTPQAIVSVGNYDDYERKSVRITNIEFPLPETSEYHSTRGYNIEFSFKSTKANQIIAYGKWASWYYYQRSIGTIGLYNGRLYTMDSYQNIGRGDIIPHPANVIDLAKNNLNTGYFLGDKRVDDGQWHHVIIQYGFNDGRTQIWIDGKLDKQIGVNAEAGGGGGDGVGIEPGYNGYNKIRPYILGFNSDDADLYSDFETSAWNYYPGRFIGQSEIGLNYLAYVKSEPIKVEPMTVRAFAGDDSRADGNKSRALLLYWWPRDNQFPAPSPTTFNFYQDVYTLNVSPPQDLNGWDLFPIDVLGRRQSPIIKPEVWIDGAYRDKKTSAPRYLDVVNDLDLDKFDAIFFLNYPETSAQLDVYVREQFADEYFGIKEKDLYQDFLKSLRAAVDTGMSLFVNTAQLAIDMGIVDRVEYLPVFNEIVNNQTDFSDFRAPVVTGSSVLRDGIYVYEKPEDASKHPIREGTTAYWHDTFNNLKHRIVTPVEYLTDDSTYILTDQAYYGAADLVDFGAPDRVWYRHEWRQNGLQVNDEIIIGDVIPTSFGMTRPRMQTIPAVPFENVKAGKIVTAQPRQYYKKNVLTDNPYANYAHIIALEENDVLNGRPVGGRIYVNFTDKFWDLTPEYTKVDLITDYWIDRAYQLGLLGPVGSQLALDAVVELENHPNYKGGGQSSDPADVYQYWTQNGDFSFMQMNSGDNYAGVLGLIFEDDVEYRKIPSTRKGLPSASRARDALGRFASGTGGSSGGLLGFMLQYGRAVSDINIYVPNMITRGLWWLSQRVRLTGLVYRSEAMTATVTLKQAQSIVDRDISIASEPMISNIVMPNIASDILRVVTYVSTPMYANAIMTVEGKNISAASMNASVVMSTAAASTFGLEPIILKVEHVNPVLYIRGDKIK